MRPQNRALAVILLAVLVVVATGGALVFLAALPGALPTTLPIPTGTVFRGNATQTWVLHFNVSGTGLRIVGAWTAYDGHGFPALELRNGTVGRPPDYLFRCPPLQPWTEANESIDTTVNPGPYTMYWGACFSASTIQITQAVQLTRSIFL